MAFTMNKEYTKEYRMFQLSFEACQQRIEKLRYSVEKNARLFPLDSEKLKNFGQEEEESLDAFILRYSQCVSIIQEQLFRGIALLEQENINDKSNRDKTLLMEKLGAIQSAEDFGSAAMLRNKFAHNYPEQSAVRMERMNLIMEEAKFVLATFRDIHSYLVKKKFIVE